MNKYILALALILMLTVSFAACASRGASDDTDTFADTSKKSDETGYPADQVQVTLLYVDGKTYMKANHIPDMNSHPFEEFTLYGKVEKNDIHNIPTEELHASHFDKGCLVYTSEAHQNFIWVVDTSRGVYTLHQCDLTDTPEQWQPKTQNGK